MADKLNVEVVFATPEHQQLIGLELPPGATVDDAIRKSRIQEQFPSQNLSELETGIWGRVVARDQLLQAGDRIEIYRPLEMNPREARRRLAAAGQTMASSNKP